jgi:hypothetical protein
MVPAPVIMHSLDIGQKAILMKAGIKVHFPILTDPASDDLGSALLDCHCDHSKDERQIFWYYCS